MLEAGQQLSTLAGTCEVKELLGEGGQGQVYRVEIAGKSLACKWYYAHTIAEGQRKALERLIQKGAPSEKFLWPLELVSLPNTAEFGYLMPLREARYVSLVDLMKRRVEVSFHTLARAGYELADSYFQLHVQGLCYRDISFGNVFLDPSDGQVLICDNDNVTVNGQTDGGVLGTSRFMAPEIVCGRALPSTNTDLFSLAVLLFYMFLFHHPLEGEKEYNIHVLDMAAMARIYGTEPLFIFDPYDHSNAPVKGYHDNALIFWPLYPQFLRDLFTRAFTDGLRDPENGRVRESEWREAMIRLQDSIFYCKDCPAENFYDRVALQRNGGKPAACWKCKNDVQLPFRLRINGNVIMLNHDTRLYPHHIDRQRTYDFSQPVAEVTRHPRDPHIWGLKNLSQENWVLTRVDGVRQEVEVGRSVTLTAGAKIHFGQQEGEVRF